MYNLTCQCNWYLFLFVIYGFHIIYKFIYTYINESKVKLGFLFNEFTAIKFHKMVYVSCVIHIYSMKNKNQL